MKLFSKTAFWEANFIGPLLFFCFQTGTDIFLLLPKRGNGKRTVLKSYIGVDVDVVVVVIVVATVALPKVDHIGR